MIRKHNQNKLTFLNTTFDNFVTQFTLLNYFVRRFNVTQPNIQGKLNNIQMSIQFHDHMQQQFSHLEKLVDGIIAKLKDGEIDLSDKSDVFFLKKTNEFIDELGKLIVTTYRESYDSVKEEFVGLWELEEERGDLENVLKLLSLNRNKTLEFRHLIIHQNDFMIETEGVDENQKVFDAADTFLTMRSERELLSKVTGIPLEEEEDDFDLF